MIESILSSQIQYGMSCFVAAEAEGSFLIQMVAANMINKKSRTSQCIILRISFSARGQ
jgi:hypothetical protein